MYSNYRSVSTIDCLTFIIHPFCSSFVFSISNMIFTSSTQWLFPGSFYFLISISLTHITERASISSMNYPVLMFSVSSSSLRTFQLSRRINVMPALSCKRIVMLLDFPSRLSSRNRNFLSFKNCAKTKNRTSYNQITSKIPHIDFQRTDLWQADQASENSSSLWPYSMWHQASFLWWEEGK
jgi:hypothetical protein